MGSSGGSEGHSMSDSTEARSTVGAVTDSLPGDEAYMKVVNDSSLIRPKAASDIERESDSNEKQRDSSPRNPPGGYERGWRVTAPVTPLGSHPHGMP